MIDKTFYFLISFQVFFLGFIKLHSQNFNFHISVRDDTIGYFEPIVISSFVKNNDSSIITAYNCCSDYYRPILECKKRDKSNNTWKEVKGSEVKPIFEYLKKTLIVPPDKKKPELLEYQPDFSYHKETFTYFLVDDWIDSGKRKDLTENEKTGIFSIRLKICPFYENGDCISSNEVNIYIQDYTEKEKQMIEDLEDLSIPHFIFSPFYTVGFKAIGNQAFFPILEAKKLIKKYQKGYIVDIAKYGIADDIFTNCIKESDCETDKLTYSKDILIKLHKKYKNESRSSIFDLAEIDYMILNINGLLGLPFNDGTDW